MTGALGRRRGDTERRRSLEDGGREHRGALQANKCQEMPGANRSEQEASKNSPLKPSEGARAFKQLDFRLLDSETMREYISVVLSHHIYGNLLGSLGN